MYLSVLLFDFTYLTTCFTKLREIVKFRLKLLIDKFLVSKYITFLIGWIISPRRQVRGARVVTDSLEIVKLRRRPVPYAFKSYANNKAAADLCRITHNNVRGYRIKSLHTMQFVIN